MKKLSVLVGAIFLLCFSVNAQKVKKQKGNIDFMKNVKSLNVEFDYSDITVGRDLPEEEYVNKKVKDHNEKTPGKGDKWLEGWVGARDERYEPKFLELTNKYLSKINIKASEDNSDAKYTLIVKTNYVEPGFHAGVMKMPSSVNLEYIFVETDNKENVLAKFEHNKIPGSQVMGYDFDAGSRLAESYAKGGKMLAKYMYKELK